MAIKKPSYVRKSDFLNFFDRPEELWFLNNEEIEGVFKSYLKKKKKQEINNLKTELNNDNDDEEEIEAEFVEFDALDFYRESAIVKTTDDDDPKFIEGKLIADQAKKFLINYCNSNLKIKNVIDFNEVYKGNQLNLKERFEYCTKIIASTHEPTLFLNPLFIANNCVAIPNALVYNKNSYELIDVKGVVSSKRYHILDLYYQIAIIKENLNNLKNAWIALIAYEKKPKNTVSFSISRFIRDVKSSSIDFIKKFSKDLPFFKNYDNLEDIYEAIVSKNKKDNFVKENIKSVLSNYSNLNRQFNLFIKKNRLPNNKENLSSNLKNFFQSVSFYSNDLILLKQYWKKHGNFNVDNLININSEILSSDSNTLIDLKKIVMDFWNITNTIHKHEVPKVLDFPISNKYKTIWKDFKYIALVRKVFEIKGYTFFGYSGKLIPWEPAIIYCESIKDLKNQTWKLEDFVKPKKLKSNKKVLKIEKEKNSELYLKVFQKTINKENKYWVSNEALINFKRLKSKKIYFDFETINQAIRVIDKSLPFMQIITQCSIIKNHGNGIEDSCLNLIVDPKDINKDFFKKIVDSLYEENFHEYSYVVYNASFERNRLKELKAILDDELYSKKIDNIIANLYDLANFFSLNKRQIVMVDLKGFYSIKLVLNLIPKTILNKTKTVDYSSLEIQKGDKAQSVTSLRFFDKISDSKWKLISKQLEKYCENDVRAMVAVEYYVKYLIENRNND